MPRVRSPPSEGYVFVEEVLELPQGSLGEELYAGGQARWSERSSIALKTRKSIKSYNGSL